MENTAHLCESVPLEWKGQKRLIEAPFTRILVAEGSLENIYVGSERNDTFPF